MTREEAVGQGPLAGLKVLEFAGIGPGPHAAMLLSDLGADVLRIDREGGNGWPNPIVDRGRAGKVVDIRSPEGRDWCLQAARLADVVIEGFRPGVMERLGLGPEVLCGENERLIYGRITGWGQEGPLAQRAGHDVNYIALSGALAAMGRPGEPAAIPLNLVGDFGGGSMFLLLGILAALWERERSGKGQVVDAAIIDGVASMMTMFTGLAPSGRLSLDRADNLLGGAAPFYRTYLCSDGGEISVGPLEPAFFRSMMDRLGLSEWVSAQYDTSRWGGLTGVLAATFARWPRDHWAALFEGSDACVFPVLTAQEVADHPHHAARASYIEHDGLMQAAPAPRLVRTPGRIRSSGDADRMIERWHTLA
ncbi:CaiB/BaiF CoA transferase family protein [Novosphingobium sediminicola]|uniref:Alpha-methylacyl-CoA racemase n=1 Tax=Novosphingobium sediminicola TaxID=563162 RepID=A0A7W6G891_9SPHN|nr:CaiB/BaiF CoA-transferase family protein [Novosphingobium sediminicola]MBB3957193.1 alpha-methylacyl-CoA racemase [Novosphingobium sediminicola]